MMRIAVINGPNLNLLGKRETDLYGKKSMEQVWIELLQAFPDLDLVYYQSNHEGQIIDWLQKEGQEADGIVLNAAGYTHTSVAIRDAVAAITAPVVEVHISDISKRETFRQWSYIADVAAHRIIGKGTNGYKEAIQWLSKQNR